MAHAIYSRRTRETSATADRHAARPVRAPEQWQRAMGNSAVRALVEASPSHRLPAAVRAEMEARFGQDFSAVRVHHGPGAASLAEAAAAKAFTVGLDIVFGAGAFVPETASGRALLAHELAHVVQQGRGGPAPTEGSERVLEASAEQAAATIANGNGTVEVAGAAAPGLARQAKPGAKIDPNDPLQREIRRLAGAAQNGPQLVVNPDGTITTIQTTTPIVITAPVPFEPDISDPKALDRAQGMGHIELGDVVQFGKGLWNGPAGWVGGRQFKVDERYGGAALVGEELSKNLVIEATTAGLGKIADVGIPVFARWARPRAAALTDRKSVV